MTDVTAREGVCPVAAFDHHSLEHAANVDEIYRAIRESGTVPHSDEYGGYHVLSRYADIHAAARDWETFSSKRDFDGPDRDRAGLSIPPNPALHLSLDELDPPEWRRVRTALGPTLAPRAVERLVPRLHEVTAYFIDRVIERGSCDLVFDLANPIPAIMILDYFGLPLDEWERYADPIHRMVYTRRDQPEYAEVLNDTVWIIDQLRLRIAQARERRADNVLDFLVHFDADGTPFTDLELLEMLYLALAGGVDTTTALMGNAFVYLADHPEERGRLLADPALLDSATEEFLRFYSPVQNLARTVARDVKVADVTMHPGDRVLMAWNSANRDETQFPDADQVKLDRFPNRHVAFGIGIHRCVGSTLARTEFKHVLREVLRRMPDYQIDRSEARRYKRLGTVNGWEQIPATFTPGPREGTLTSL
jgi:cytochrome P450